MFLFFSYMFGDGLNNTNLIDFIFYNNII